MKQNIISILVGCLYRSPYIPCEHTHWPFRVNPWMACVNSIQYLLVDSVLYVCVWYLCAGPSCNGVVLASLRGEVYCFSSEALQIDVLVGPVDLITTLVCHLLFKFTKGPHIKLRQFVFMAGGITARFQKERSFQYITGGQQKDLTWRLIHARARRRCSWTRMPLQNNMVLECILKHK